MSGTGRNKKGTAEKRMLFAGILIIALLLLLIAVTGIIRARKAKEEAESLAEYQRQSESVSIEESIEASIAESLAQIPKLTLTESTNPEVLDLVDRYFNSRLNADTEGLAALFAREAGERDAELAQKLSAQQSWVRSYDDISVYVLPGMEKGELIGVVTYRVNFRRVNQKAPGIMYFYAKTDAEGNWHLCENLVKETRDFIDDSFAEAGVQSLIDENTRALHEALSSDSDLALMYESFMNGEIYADYNLDYDREQTVDLFLNPEDSVLISQE